MVTPEICNELNFGPLDDELLTIARNQGEDPDRVCLLLEEFRDLIYQKGEYIPHRTDDDFLIKFLRARFWKINNSYNLLHNYCKFRNANKELHDKVYPLDLKHVGDADIVSVTPYKDQLGRRIIIYRFGNWIPSQISVNDIFKVTLLLLEIGALEPSVQILGGIGIFDLTNLSLHHILYLTPSVVQKMLDLIVTSMPTRTHAIHIINQNWVFSTAFSIFKPFLNSKMKERIFIHGNDMLSLHKHILPQNLPKRYGGIHEDFPYTLWMENLIKNNTVIKELKSLGYVVFS